jgi:hypothetical protein
MPRLEDGQLETSASKFKKRRAWLPADDAVLASTDNREKATHDSTVILPTPLVQIDGGKEYAGRLKQKTETRVKHDQNMTGTRVKHDWNMSGTRVEHDYNKTESLQQAISNDHNLRLKHDWNMDETRVEHDQNMNGTRVKHEWNKSESTSIDSFFAFIIRQREDLTASHDEEHWLLLGLSNVQRRMFWHVAINCIERGAQRTGPIEIKSFFSPLSISTDVVRTSLKRLTEKGLLQREKGKLGKDGFAIISLPRAIHDIAKELFTHFISVQAS